MVNNNTANTNAPVQANNGPSVKKGVIKGHVRRNMDGYGYMLVGATDSDLMPFAAELAYESFGFPEGDTFVRHVVKRIIHNAYRMQNAISSYKAARTQYEAADPNTRGTEPENPQFSQPEIIDFQNFKRDMGMYAGKYTATLESMTVEEACDYVTRNDGSFSFEAPKEFVQEAIANKGKQVSALEERLQNAMRLAGSCHIESTLKPRAAILSYSSLFRQMYPAQAQAA
jgi:hypothetical protein